MNFRFISIGLILQIFASGVYAQFRWEITHPEVVDEYNYAFTSVSCSGEACTAAALKILNSGFHNTMIFVRSTNGGKTWNEQDPGLPYQIAQNQNQFQKVQQINSLNTVAIADSGLVLRTFDGGQSWVKQIFDTAKLVDVHFSDSANGIIATAFGNIYTTSDAGRTWLFSPFHFPFLYIVHCYGPQQYSVMEYGGRGRIYATSDNWKSVDSTEPFLTTNNDPDGRFVIVECNFSNKDSTVVAYGTYWNKDSMPNIPYCFMVHSSDRGKHWEKPFIHTGNFLRGWMTMSSVEQDTIIVGADMGLLTILLSTDRGVHWRADSIFLKEKLPINSVFDITFTETGHPIAVFSQIGFRFAQSLLTRGNYPNMHIENLDLIVHLTKIYPNPASNQLAIKTYGANKSLRILDLLGREISRAMTSDDGSVHLNISSYPYGLYCVQLEENGLLLPIGKFVVSQ